MDKSTNPQLAIYAAGGLGTEILALIGAINRQSPTWTVVGFFDDDLSRKGEEVMGYTVLGGLDELNVWKEELALVVAVGNPEIRKKLAAGITNQKITFPKLIHPTAVLDDPESIVIGQGVVITAGCVLTTNIAIGDYCLFNLNTTCGHGVKIGDFSAIMPGVNIAGEVTIEENVFIGSGANILNGRKIGAGSFIGAGSVVNKDIPPNSTAVGVPARVIKTNSTDT